MIEWVDAIALYWLGIKLLLYLSAIFICISSADDAFIDLYYWVYTAYRKFIVRTEHPRMKAAQLYTKDEQAIAVMVPAWQESDVIKFMADNSAKTFDYDRYHIFIGTYPNDPETQAEVDAVVKAYPNIHKVITTEHGPTTKADCLNHIIDHIFKFEKANGFEFACLAYHDAEDVVHPLELKLFNYLIPRKDLIQLPVLPLPRRYSQFVGGHYMDEFAEAHGKDVIVREHLTGNVPSAGVATAFSRRAIFMLSNLNNGMVFDTGSLTEDYEIGYRLKELGAKEVFVRFPVLFEDKMPGRFQPDKGAPLELVAVREYFPAKFWFSVRQKSRWIVGIVFQGWKNIGWPKQWSMRYIMMRDRKAVIAHPATLIAYFVLLNILIMEINTGLNDDSWWFPSLIPYDSWLWNLLYINGFFLLNRLTQRFYFTTRQYGFIHGLLSIPRAVVANGVNITAFFRALSQTRTARKTGRPVVWDKTSHDFPDLHP